MQYETSAYLFIMKHIERKVPINPPIYDKKLSILLKLRWYVFDFSDLFISNLT